MKINIKVGKYYKNTKGDKLRCLAKGGGRCLESIQGFGFGKDGSFSFYVTDGNGSYEKNSHHNLNITSEIA